MKLSRELTNLGIDHRLLTQQLRRGELVRIRRGAFREPGDLTPEQAHLELLRATLAATPTEVAASHVSAAVVHALPMDRRQLSIVHLVQQGAYRSHTRGRVARYHHPILDTADVDGIPVTSLATTTTDLTRTLEFRDGVAVADAALRRTVDRDVLLRLIDAEPGRRGNGRARAVIAFANPRAESPGESHSRVQMAYGGAPAPELQFELADAIGMMRTDFAWPQFRLLGEYDGAIKYGRAIHATTEDIDRAIFLEKQRELRLRRLGWWVIRFVWADLSSPVQVAQIVADGIEVARPLVAAAANRD